MQEVKKLEEEKVEEEVVEESPAEEAEEAPAEEPAEEPAAEEPKVEEAEDEEKPDELSELKAQIEKLTKMVTKLSKPKAKKELAQKQIKPTEKKQEITERFVHTLSREYGVNTKIARHLAELRSKREFVHKGGKTYCADVEEKW